MSDLKPLQVEKMLIELHEMKSKLLDAKAILKHFKIKSDRLSQLKKAYGELKEQMADEKKKIEDEFLQDKDYEAAHNDELTLKSDIKEKNAQLREALAAINTKELVSTYSYNIKGEELKVQVQRNVKVFINGREER
jgi:hypothetical protein